MKKMIAFCIIFIICFPLSVLALFMALLGACVAPVVWVATGDEEKAWSCVYGGIQDWLISLPYRIIKIDP